MARPSDLFGIDNLVGIITELVEALNTTQCDDAPTIVFDGENGTQVGSISRIDYENGEVVIYVEQD